MPQYPENVTHIAIPCRDLDEALEFYSGTLGCKHHRRYHDRVTFNFFGAQLVCHLCPDEIVEAPHLYPRHFGMTLRNEADFDTLLHAARDKGLRFYAEPFIRFGEMRETHRAFVIYDPSNNLLEFKYYDDPEMIY